MNFLEAFEAPIVEKIGGIFITFPALEIDDYTSWITELTAAKRDTGRKTIPKAIDPVTKLPAPLDPTSKWNIDQRIENIEAGLEDVAAKVWTKDGAVRILNLSLTKAGVSDADRAAIIKRVRPQKLNLLASKVSALFEEQPVEKAGADPNSSSPAANQNSADGATGSMNESSSTATPGETPAA